MVYPSLLLVLRSVCRSLLFRLSSDNVHSVSTDTRIDELFVVEKGTAAGLRGGKERNKKRGKEVDGH